MDTLATPDPEPDPRPRANANWPGADIVKAECSAAGYSSEQISDVLWLLDWVKIEKVPNYAALCDRLKWDGDQTVISRIMRGKYPGNTEKFFAKISGFRKTLIARQDFGDEPVVETSVLKKISTFCDLARESATIALLHGPNQSGKTTAIETYRARNNHGRTIYVRTPVGGSTGMFTKALIKSCGLSQQNAYDQRRERILGFFDPTMLLIVDEVHQAFLKNLRMTTIEFIREIHDLCRCGVVLCGTDVLPQMMMDQRHKDFLGQIANRGVLRLRIPPKPSMDDVHMICTAYGLGKPEGDALGIVREIAATAGIGKLVKYLRLSRRLAVNKMEAIAWKHFLTTHATLTKWAKGEEED